MPAKKQEPTAISIALTTSAQSQQDVLMSGIDNFELPKSLVARVAKQDLPENVKLGRETVDALTKGSSVFINYLSAAAQDVAKSRGHKNVAAADVLKALEMIEFSDFAIRLEDDLEAYREGGKKSKPRDSTTTKKKSNTKDGAAYKGKIRGEPGTTSAVKPPPAPGGGTSTTPGDEDVQMDGREQSDRDDFTDDTGGADDETADEDVDDEEEEPEADDNNEEPEEPVKLQGDPDDDDDVMNG